MTTLQSILERALPQGDLALLRSIGDRAAEVGLPLYLVGGSVRDLLLGRAVKDLDLVVEGDASLLAFEAAKVLGGEVVSYSRFGTATVKLDGRRLDLATARREVYTRPGALPRVSPGTILEDLGRRDFSINAMALSLTSPRFGELLDIYGGMKDLQSGLVRVLHDRSFIDDATRILRAIRYEQRLGFRLETQTKRLLLQALKAGMMDTISGDRIRRELELILKEEHPYPPLLRAARLGVLWAIYQPLGDGPALRRLREAKGLEPLVYLAALAYPLSQEEAEGFIKRLNMPSRWAQVVRHTLGIKEREKELAEPSLPPERLCQLLDDHQPPAIRACALLAAERAARERLHLYLQRLRYVKPVLNGRELLALGVPQGPMVGELLRRLRRERLRGRVCTKEEGEAFVREFLAKGE